MFISFTQDSGIPVKLLTTDFMSGNFIYDSTALYGNESFLTQILFILITYAKQAPKYPVKLGF